MGHESLVVEFPIRMFLSLTGNCSRRHLYLAGSRGILAFRAISLHCSSSSSFAVVQSIVRSSETETWVLRHGIRIYNVGI